VTILWIEDAAYTDYASLLTWVLVDGRFAIDVASDASVALNKLATRRYEVVILDLHLPPGQDRFWADRYQRIAAEGRVPLLGLELLEEALSRAASEPALSWLSPERICVLSIESPGWIQQRIREAGVSRYREKDLFLPEGVLVEIAADMLGEQGVLAAEPVIS
jgi:CheY-like chemotaxis protein